MDGPLEFRSAKTPCRHIPLNEAGETLDVLYRYDDQPEVEESVGKWLRTTIAQLEEARKTILDSSQLLRVQDHAEMQGAPLFQKLHPKCANPACATAFHSLGGGMISFIIVAFVGAVILVGITRLLKRA